MIKNTFGFIEPNLAEMFEHSCVRVVSYHKVQNFRCNLFCEKTRDIASEENLNLLAKLIVLFILLLLIRPLFLAF